jgi:hypothetical protein
VCLREHLRISIRTGRQLAGLARVLDQRPALDAALSTGVVNTEQAQVIATAIADLPKEACAEDTDKAGAGSASGPPAVHRTGPPGVGVAGWRLCLSGMRSPGPLVRRSSYRWGVRVLR